MDKDEWLRRCAAQYEKRAGLAPAEALNFAQIALEGDADGDFTNEPEEAADEDMSYWTDDGE